MELQELTAALAASRWPGDIPVSEVQARGARLRIKALGRLASADKERIRSAGLSADYGGFWLVPVQP